MNIIMRTNSLKLKSNAFKVVYRSLHVTVVVRIKSWYFTSSGEQHKLSHFCKIHCNIVVFYASKGLSSNPMIHIRKAFSSAFICSVLKLKISRLRETLPSTVQKCSPKRNIGNLFCRITCVSHLRNAIYYHCHSHNSYHHHHHYHHNYHGMIISSLPSLSLSQP